MEKEVSKIKRATGKLIDNTMKEKRITKYFISKVSGVQITQVGDIIKGEKDYTFGSLIKVCKVLDIPGIPLVDIK